MMFQSPLSKAAWRYFPALESALHAVAVLVSRLAPTTCQGDQWSDQHVGTKSVKYVDQADHPLQGRWLTLPRGRDVLKGFSRCDHHTPSKAASTAAAGRSTRHGLINTA